MSLPPLLDGHNDVLLALQRAAHRGERPSFRDGLPGQLDLPRARAGGLAGGFFACFVPPSLDRPAIELSDVITSAGGWSVPYPPPLDDAHALDTTLAMIARLRELEREGSVTIAHDAAQLRMALATPGGPLAAILHLEGAEAVGERVDRLELLYALGVRSIGLVWSRPNRFASGVAFAFPASPDDGPGLTAAGERLVDGCNELGIMLDLSHLNERGFWDVTARSRAPLVATHSACHALTPSARNLTDKQLDAIGASGGLVGINLSVPDLRADGRNDPDTPLERVCEHAAHVAGRIGVEHVALGSDLDGAMLPAAIGDAAGLSRLLDALMQYGWDEHALTAFAHGNWLRVLDATWR